MAVGGVAVEHVGVITDPMSVIGAPHASPSPLQPTIFDGELEQATSPMAATSAQVLAISSFKPPLRVSFAFAIVIDTPPCSCTSDGASVMRVYRAIPAKQLGRLREARHPRREHFVRVAS